jgi:peptide/nickel transport system permease protein
MSATGSVSGAVGTGALDVAVGSRRGRHPLAVIVARRVAVGLLTLFIVSIFIFVATNVLPGNVAEAVLGQHSTPAVVHALEVKLDLQRSMFERYVSWLGGMMHGDFGKSAVAVANGDPNSSIAAGITTPLKNSLMLATITTILLIPLTLILGTLAGVHANRRLDHGISVPALVAGGLPEFVTATLLIAIFFSTLHLLPPVSLLPPGESPLVHPNLLVLPVLTLLTVALGSGVRQVRAGMIEVLDQDYVRVAQLNGIRGRRILYRYAVRNALAPAVQSIAQNIQYLVGGILIVETVFSYPGIGTYLVQAVSVRDITQVQAAALILAAIYIFINIAADVIVILLVPKLRTGLYERRG